MQKYYQIKKHSVNLNLSRLTQQTILKKLSQIKSQNKVQVQLIQGLYLSGCKKIQISIFHQFPQLKILNINGSKINDKQLLNILNYIPFLEQLYLKGCKQLSQFQFPQLKHLNKLDLSSTNIHQYQLEKLVQYNLPSLKDTNLSKCEVISFQNISKWVKLTHINLSSTLITDSQVIKLFDYCQNIQQIVLQCCKSINQLNLSNHQELKRLSLESSLVKILKIQNLQSLQKLNLNSCTKLKMLAVKGCCYQIQQLNLKRTFYLEQIYLQNLYKLIDLNLRSCQYNLAKITLKYLHSLKSLNISYLKVQILQLQNLINLSHINFKFCSKIQYVEVTHCPLIQQLNFSQMLKKLYLSQNKRLSRLNIQYCHNLKVLSIKQCQILQNIYEIPPNVNEITIQHLDQLEKIYWRQSKICNQFSIKNCYNLKSISLYKSSLSQKQINHIFSQLSQTIQILELQSASNINVLKLNGFLKLKKLSLMGSTIQQLDLQKFPHLQILNLNNCRQLYKMVFTQCNDSIANLMLENTLIGDNIIKSIQNSISKSLKMLDLSSCVFLSKYQLSNFVNLQKLSLKNSSINSKQVSDLVKLKKLQQINLSMCKKLKKVEMIGPSLIRYVNLNKSGFQYLEINQLQNLETIYFDQCDNSSQMIIKNCNKIQVINISSHQMLSSLKLQNLKILQKLIIKYCFTLNQIKIKNCSSIKQIHIVDGYLKGQNICKQLIDTQLKNLQELHLPNNKIFNLQAIAQINISSLKKLNLQKNQIRSLKSLGKIQSSVNSIFLSQNPIKDCQFSKANFRCLNLLNLYSVQINLLDLSRIFKLQTNQLKWFYSDVFKFENSSYYHNNKRLNQYKLTLKKRFCTLID